MALNLYCVENNSYLSDSGVSCGIFHCQKPGKDAEYADSVRDDPDVDQHACAELLYTEGSVLLGMVYNFLPFMVLQIQTSLSKMDHSLLEASADLGAGPIQTFGRVTLPLSLPGVINGITLVFLPAVSSFFIPKLLGGGQYFLIGNMIENQFITVGEWNFGSAISMIMAVIMMLLMMAVRKIEIHNQGGKGERV